MTILSIVLSSVVLSYYLVSSERCRHKDNEVFGTMLRQHLFCARQRQGSVSLPEKIRGVPVLLNLNQNIDFGQFLTFVSISSVMRR